MDMPTGPNPLPGLHEFTVKQTVVKVQGPQGSFSSPNYSGHFWLVGLLVVASSHLLPAGVKAGLKENGFTVPACTPIRRT